MRDAEKPSADWIADRMTNAVMEQRLAPGSKLSEARMAGAFDVSRTKIRQALTLLSRSGLVQLYPNRGAYIVSPTVAEAREIMAARRLLEPDIVKNVLMRAGRRDIKRLRAHLDDEKTARQTADRRAVIRLSGDFHMRLADMAGNRYIARVMGQLCPLTCLVIALYDLPQTPACPEGEHDAIVAAIAARDEPAAIAAMRAHLEHIERALRLDTVASHDVDWESLLG